jgi:hypothetical protein
MPGAGVSDKAEANKNTRKDECYPEGYGRNKTLIIGVQQSLYALFHVSSLFNHCTATGLPFG